MQSQKQIHSLRQLLKLVRAAGKSIALVPTMGNLHEGHLQLVRQAKDRYDYTVCSIFVNPLQFAANEDLDAYPRTLERDREQLEVENCDCLFLPSVEEIYGEGLDRHTSISVPELTDNFCGSSRPGHFDGVATIVTKLFNIVQPHSAFFGLKDYQQFLVIKKLTRDLALDIKIHGIETHREESGLAMSSRNNYLNNTQREHATALYRALQNTAKEIQSGSRDFESLESTASKNLIEAGFTPDYFQICDGDTLHAATQETENFAVLAAAFMGKTRLIDNIRFRTS